MASRFISEIISSGLGRFGQFQALDRILREAAGARALGDADELSIE
jgi:hypothetical protein